MSQRLAVLTDALAALSQAAERLASTHDGVAAMFPLVPDMFQTLPEPAKERLDAYAIRYARCQDLLFPAMRALGRAQLEPKADASFAQRNRPGDALGVVARRQRAAGVRPSTNPYESGLPRSGRQTFAGLGAPFALQRSARRNSRLAPK